LARAIAPSPDEASDGRNYVRRHLRFGWWSLLVFAAFGLLLELFHGFKVQAYLNASMETRRLMWTLAHAHGSLLALAHVVFGLTLRSVPELNRCNLRLISFCLLAASFLLPGGFFLGGIVVYNGDPSFGIVLLPIGATLLMIGIFLIARGTVWVGRTDGTRRHDVTRGQKVV
jgi:hypothetical protein